MSEALSDELPRMEADLAFLKERRAEARKVVLEAIAEDHVLRNEVLALEGSIALRRKKILSHLSDLQLEIERQDAWACGWAEVAEHLSKEAESRDYFPSYENGHHEGTFTCPGCQVSHDVTSQDAFAFGCKDDCPIRGTAAKRERWLRFTEPEPEECPDCGEREIRAHRYSDGCECRCGLQWASKNWYAARVTGTPLAEVAWRPE